MQPSPPLAPPRVALLMVSLSPHAAKTSSTTHEVVLDAWRQHVVEPLTRDVPGTLLRSFLCFHPSGIFEPTKGSAAPSLEARRAHVSELYANISEEVEVVLASAEPLREQSELGAADPGSVLAERLGIFARRLEQLTEPATCVECCTCGLCESDALMFMSI